MSMFRRAMDYLGLGPDEAYDDYDESVAVERDRRMPTFWHEASADLTCEATLPTHIDKMGLRSEMEVRNSRASITKRAVRGNRKRLLGLTLVD